MYQALCQILILIISFNLYNDVMKYIVIYDILDEEIEIQ